MRAILHKRSGLASLLCIALLGLGLVQVTRADSMLIPVPVGGSVKPSHVVDLGTTSVPADGIGVDVVEITTGAANAGVYTVPAGKVLVLSTVIVFPQSPGAGKILLQLIQGTVVRKYWVVSNAEPTQLGLGPGLVVATGNSLSIKNFATSDGSIRVNLFGYEADDR